MEPMTPVESLLLAIEKIGNQSKFAAELTRVVQHRLPDEAAISPARVWNWVNRDMQAPSELCPDIESITGVRCEALRPDVNWSVLRKKPKPPANEPDKATEGQGA